LAKISPVKFWQAETVAFRLLNFTQQKLVGEFRALAMELHSDLLEAD